MKRESSRQIFENFSVSVSVKILPVESKVFLADSRTGRHTHMTKLIVAFHNFVNAPKNLQINSYGWNHCSRKHSFENFFLMWMSIEQTCGHCR